MTRQPAGTDRKLRFTEACSPLKRRNKWQETAVMISNEEANDCLLASYFLHNDFSQSPQLYFRTASVPRFPKSSPCMDQSMEPDKRDPTAPRCLYQPYWSPFHDPLLGFRVFGRISVCTIPPEDSSTKGMTKQCRARSIDAQY